jgi:hypothetical protein
MTRRRVWLAAAGIVLCSALALGAARRVGNPRLAFCGSTDEFSEFMPGLRLHALPLWNVGADVRSNFFKSLLYSPHGFGDSAFYYVAGGVLHGLGLSISDRHLWLASAFTNGLLIAAVVWLSLAVARSPGMAYAAMLLMALSPLYVFSSQTAFARITFVPLAQVSALALAAFAHRRRRWPAATALALTVLFVELTDGFYFGPVVLAFLFLLRGGSPCERIAGVIRDRVWWLTAAAIAAGLAIDVGLGALAAAHDTTLTLFGYVRVRVGYGGVLSSMDLLKLWLEAFQKYIPIVGAAVVIPAWLVAWRYAWSDPVAGALAVWLGIASAGVVRYYASATGTHIPGVGPLTAYPLALPSYLVVAWACGRGWRRGAGASAYAAALVACAAAVPSAAVLATERYDPDLQFRGERYVEDLDRCVMVKAAGAYVREQAVPGAMVFHLAEDMPLGVYGEFYYGLSYVGNNHTGERNRIVDFGTQAVRRRYTPEQLAQAYGVPHFTYYVEFLPVADPFTRDAVQRLERSGARVALEVRDSGRLLGRLWRFDAPQPQVMELKEVARRWDRVGGLPQLFQQSLAGTAYHFGAVWPRPPE